MAIQTKSRLSESLANLAVSGVLAILSLIVLAIIGIWYKPIWSTNTALYIIIFTLPVMFVYYGLLGILANFGGLVGRLCFLVCLLTSLILLIFGVVNIFTNDTIFLAFVASNSLIIIAGLQHININGKKFDDFAVYMLVPYVLHLIVIPVIAGTDIPNVVALFVCGIEVLYALVKIFNRKARRSGMFYNKASETVEVDEETEDEAELRRAIRAQNRETAREIRKIRREEIKKALGSSSNKNKGGRSSKYDDYSGEDWCDEFRRKMDGCAGVYDSVMAEVSDYTGAGIIEVDIEIVDNGDDGHTKESTMNIVENTFNKIARKCPYECRLNISWR